jgi:hypothetical protein
VGKSTSEISQELEQTRSDAAEKIGKIEEQVTQSAESVKESLDWRHQVEARPMLAVGAAFLGGMLLGGMSGGGNGGDNGGQHRTYSYIDAENQGSSMGSKSQGGGISGALKNAAHTSGADEAFSSAAAALLTTATQRVKGSIDEAYPGFLERYESSKSASGGVSERMKAAANAEVSGDGAQMTA